MGQRGGSEHSTAPLLPPIPASPAHPVPAVLQQQVEVAVGAEVPVQPDDVAVAQAAVQLQLVLHLHWGEPRDPPNALPSGRWGWEARDQPRTREGGRAAGVAPLLGVSCPPRLTLSLVPGMESRARGITFAA